MGFIPGAVGGVAKLGLSGARHAANASGAVLRSTGSGYKETIRAVDKFDRWGWTPITYTSNAASAYWMGAFHVIC